MTRYQYVREKRELLDGIVLGIDKMEIRIPWKRPSLENIDPKSETAKRLRKASKDKFESHLHFVQAQIMENFDTELSPGTSINDKLKRLAVFSRKDGSRVATIMYGLHFGNPVLTYQFNPSKLTDDGRWELNLLLEMTLPFEYATLYSQGVISRIEPFIDVLDVRHGDLVLLDTGRRKTTLYETTTYQGRRKSPLAATMYDKAKQLGLDMLWTRIEARIHRDDLTLQDFVESGIPNPFAPFLVVSAAALETVAKEWNRPQLVSEITQHGLKGGIKNSKARRAITLRLKEMTVPWWDPDHIWRQFREMTWGFHPSIMLPIRS